MILEQILKFFGIENGEAGSTIETFHSIPEIISFFQKIYPEASVERSQPDDTELGIYIIRKDKSKIFIPVRESQKSGYYLIEIPKEIK